MPWMNFCVFKNKFYKIIVFYGYIRKREISWFQTTDSYANNVSFIINNLEINKQIVDDFFKIPLEKDL